MTLSPLFHALCYGFFGSNHGDRAVTRGALELIHQIYPDDGVRIVSEPLSKFTRAGWLGTKKDYPFATLREWSSNLALFRHETSPSIEVIGELLDAPALLDAYVAASGIKGARSVWIGGGEQLFSYDQDQDWALASRILPFLAAARAGVAVRCVPTTFGPFETPVSQALFAELERSSSKLIVRDHNTQEVVEAVLPGTRKMPFGLDPAFFLKTAAPVKAGRMASPLRFAFVPRSEGFGLRVGAKKSKAYITEQRGRQFQNSAAFKFYAAALLDCLDKGNTATLMVQAQADQELCDALFEACSTHPRADLLALVRPKSLGQHISIIRTHHAVVTSRFHSAIFALITGVTPIGIYSRDHGHKTPGLFDAFGRSSFCLCLEDSELSERYDVVSSLTTKQFVEDGHCGFRSVASMKEATLSLY